MGQEDLGFDRCIMYGSTGWYQGIEVWGGMGRDHRMGQEVLEDLRPGEFW